MRAWLATAPAFAAAPALNAPLSYSDNRVLRAAALIEETADSVLRAVGLGHAELFKEFLDLGEPRGEAYPRPLAHVDRADHEGPSLLADMIGATVQPAPLQTIEPAMRLHPKACPPVVITGSSLPDRHREALSKHAFEPLRERIAIDCWAGLPMAEELRRLAALPRDAIALRPGFRQDGDGARFTPQQADAELSALN